MSDILNQDSLFMNFLNTICDLIILNFIFIICCIPIITIGSSLTALFSVSLKLCRKESPVIMKSFFHSFRENFRQSTVLWILFLLIYVILFIDYHLFSGILKTICAIVFLFTCCSIIYIFPIISRFVCTRSQTIKNSILMAFGHFPYTVLFLIIYAIVPILCSFSVKIFLTISCIYLIFGFSITALCTSFLYNHIFKRYEMRYTKSGE